VLVKPLARLVARTWVLPEPDIDTDQIIPARFLKTTQQSGLGRHLFADRRTDPAFSPGSDAAGERAVLVAGPNFGCGSSREHAVWALLDAGVRAVVSARFADIFRANAERNGLLAVELEEAWVHRLAAAPGASVELDVQAGTLGFEGRSTTFAQDPFARRCLLAGVDELGYLLAAEAALQAHERRRRCAP
jgi:3-isopropylmalate/(R)-2-methylmalate dehydratase small subunit